MGEAKRRGTFEQRKAKPKGRKTFSKFPIRIWLPKWDGNVCKLGTTIYKSTARGWVRLN